MSGRESLGSDGSEFGLNLERLPTPLRLKNRVTLVSVQVPRLSFSGKEWTQRDYSTLEHHLASWKWIYHGGSRV